MKKHTIATSIVFMFIITMMLPVLADAQSEDFTIGGEVRFHKTGNIYLKVLTEDQYKADDHDDDDNEHASDDHKYVARLVLEIGEKKMNRARCPSRSPTSLPACMSFRGFRILMAMKSLI